MDSQKYLDVVLEKNHYISKEIISEVFTNGWEAHSIASGSNVESELKRLYNEINDLVVAFDDVAFRLWKSEMQKKALEERVAELESHGNALLKHNKELLKGQWGSVV